MDDDQILRQHVQYLLDGGGAHLDFERAIEGLTSEFWGQKPPEIPYSPWQLLEHLRICQWDILEYVRNPNHESPEFPKGFWPDDASPPSDLAWDQSVAAFRDDLKAVQELVADPETKLLAQIPHGKEGHTVLREALLVADHNAYHFGQLVVVRRALGVWTE